MNANTETLPGAPAANTKPLWAAVGVLSVAVLAMGAGLIYTQTRTSQPVETAVAIAPLVAAPEVVSTAQSIAADEVVETTPANKPVAVAAKPAPAKAKAAPVPSPAPVVAAAPAPAPMVVAAAEPAPPVVVSQPAARPICGNCGTIESVTPIQRKGEAKGVGAVAGGVLGAVVGNQIGHGGGRTAATVLGALGGGYAGHAIEKNVRKETVYQARVRMEDGSVRTIEQASSPIAGSRVVIDNGVMHSADGSWSPTPPVAGARPPVQTTEVSNRN